MALATGGFGYNDALVKLLCPAYEGEEMRSSAQNFVDGRGLRVNSETPVKYTAGISRINPDASPGRRTPSIARPRPGVRPPGWGRWL